MHNLISTELLESVGKEAKKEKRGKKKLDEETKSLHGLCAQTENGKSQKRENMRREGTVFFFYFF